MKAKQLILLVIACALLGGIAWWTSRDEAAESSLIGSNLLEDVDLNAIDEIIVTAGADKCRVVRNETGWVMPARYGFAANFSKVRDLLLKLADLEIGQIAEVSEDQKNELGVTPAAATTIKLYAEGTEIAALMLGDARERPDASSAPMGSGSFPDGRYVSADGGATVCLVGDPIREATTQTEDWLDADLLNIAAADITRLRIEPTDGDAFEIVRNTDGTLAMTDLAEGEEYDTSKSYAIENALSHLRLKDVADPKLSDADLGFENPSAFHVWTKDGRQFDISISSPIGVTNDRYARIAVEFVAPETSEAEAEAEDSEADGAAQDESERIKAEVTDLNSRLGKWTFRIEGYKAGAFCKPRSELLKEPEETESNEPTAEPETAKENTTT